MTTQAPPSRQEAVSSLLSMDSMEAGYAVWGAVGMPPNPHQRKILASKARMIQLVAGEQAGKSAVAAMWASDRMLEGDGVRQNLGWIVGKHYEMTRFIYDYLMQYVVTLGSKKSATTDFRPGLITTIDNCVIRTKSALDAESLMGEAPHWIIIDEAAQLPWESVLRVFGRSGPNRARVMICSTYEGSIGWYPETYDRWSMPAVQLAEDVEAFRFPSWFNTAKYPGGENDPEILRLRRIMTEDQFNERIAAIAAPPQGLVHKAFRNAIHASKPLDFQKGEHIYIGIDPGRAESAYAVVVAQKPKDGPLKVIDCIYEAGRTTEEVIDIAKNRFWWRQGPMHGTIDRAGDQKKTNSQFTDADIWNRAGLFCRYDMVPILEGISRINSMLRVDPITGSPGILVDPDRCVGLISEWGGCASPIGGGIKVYQWERNRDGEILGGVPRDRYNDASKALAYLVCLNFPQFNQAGERNFIPVKRFRKDERDLKALTRR